MEGTTEGRKVGADVGEGDGKEVGREDAVGTGEGSHDESTRKFFMSFEDTLTKFAIVSRKEANALSKMLHASTTWLFSGVRENTFGCGGRDEVK